MTWRALSIRPYEPVDFDNRYAMFAECQTWQKPFVKVGTNE